MRGRETGGVAAAQAVDREGATVEAAGRARAERTKRGDVQGARSAQGGPNYVGCWQGTRGAHVKHSVHVCDAGRVEAQRLVERPRVLPSREGSIGRRATCGRGDGSVWRSGGGASRVQGMPSCGGC
eukprot:scaffold36956_cov62-Phaeocystis_antarctica.AAC.4